MDGLIVKSIQCPKSFVTSHKAVLNIAVIVKSNLSEHQHVEVDGWNHFLFREGSTPVPVDSRSQQKWGTGDIMVVGSKHLSRVINTSFVVCTGLDI